MADTAGEAGVFLGDFSTVGASSLDFLPPFCFGHRRALMAAVREESQVSYVLDRRSLAGFSVWLFYVENIGNEIDLHENSL